MTLHSSVHSCITATANEWLDQFFGNCTGCRVDFMTAHICALHDPARAVAVLSSLTWLMPTVQQIGEAA